uniref:NFACT RNA-binding domain-containing protein n=1 Tax=Pyramimonas orientalis virus TaxID=455367 RepID=A0A7M3UP86_POV01|nr:hypothetical protein HWQ62_00426 [Pyramimonas orientalis virus]
MKVIQDEKCKYYIGGNARENWNMLNCAEGHDIWIHLKDCSSCYVIVVLRELKEMSLEDIMYACSLCKSYSKMRDEKKKVKCCYTEVRNVVKGRCVGQAVMLVPPTVISI